MKKSVAAAAIAGSMLVGGGVGAALFAPGLAGAADTPTTTTPSQSNATPGTNGTSGSNEDATHEKNETAAEEAAEDSGQGRRGCDHDHGTATPPTTTAPAAS